MINDRHLLVRDLFSTVRILLIDSIRRVNLPNSYLDHIYDTSFDIQSVQSTSSFLSYVIKIVANQFGLTMVELIEFLRVKQKSNATFHLDCELKEFARRHITDEKYDLFKFIEQEQLLINVDVVEMKKLQSVFENVCRILNNQRYTDCSLFFFNGIDVEHFLIWTTV